MFHILNLIGGIRTMVNYYAVAKGRKPGIYNTWAECQAQVTGFPGAIFKKFPSRGEASQFIQDRSDGSIYKPEDTAIALGTKGPPPKEWKCTATSIPKQADFWPDEEEDATNDVAGVTDDDLLAAMNEVEGVPSSSTCTKKRKFDSDSGLGSSAKLPKHDSIVLKPVGLKRIGSFEFLIDDEGFVIAYTDGSCLRNGQANASAGYGVYFGDGHALNTGKPVNGRVTNNVGEIQAAIYAIKIAQDLGIKKLCISTDSQFLINSITMWVSGWKRRNWCLKNGDPVKNVVDFKELDELLQNKEINVKWNYVKGHKGIKGNEMADKLAREGAAIYEKTHYKK